MHSKIYHTCFSGREMLQAPGKAARLLATLSFLLCFAALFPTLTFAGKVQLTLDMDDSMFRGSYRFPATIHLKKALHQQYPWVDIEKAHLYKIILEAKSMHGYGQAQLRVGEKRTASYRVDGVPMKFHVKKARTFDRVELVNPASRSRGPWQVDLRGNFIVKKITVVVDSRSRTVSKSRHTSALVRNHLPQHHPVVYPAPRYERNGLVFHW